jgi:hypothetical protein
VQANLVSLIPAFFNPVPVMNKRPRRRPVGFRNLRIHAKKTKKNGPPNRWRMPNLRETRTRSHESSHNLSKLVENFDQ